MIVSQAELAAPRAERLAFLYEARAAAAALEAADSLGVLDRLERGPVDPATLADATNMPVEAAGLLLSALVSLGLADGDVTATYRAAPDLAGLRKLLQPWHQLTEGLCHGPLVAADTPEGAEAHYSGQVGRIASFYSSAVVRAAEHLSLYGTHVLDLGAGAAPWSLAIAAREPSCHVTAVELPAIISHTRRAIEAAGLEDRFRCIAGDLFTVDLTPDAFDLVLVANLCHLFDEPTNRRLLARAAQALKPGGALAIIDLLPNESGDGPRWLVLYALGLALRTATGRVHPFSAFVSWLRDAGCRGVERIELTTDPPLTLVRARKS